MSKVDRTRVARVLVDAHLMGDQRAAERNGLSPRTIRNYRRRLDSDERLAAVFRARMIQAEREWSSVAVAFLRRGIEKMDELVAKATEVADLDKVRAAVQTVGELQVVVEALSEQGAGAAREGHAGPTPQGVSADDDGGEDLH